jgi:WD40 repeat protein
MIDPEELEPNQEFEYKVRNAFPIRDPDQLFIERLQDQLADRFKGLQQSTESKKTGSGRSTWLDRRKLQFSPLAWGAIGIIFILLLVWGIKTLIPKLEPIEIIQSTPAPSAVPTIIPSIVPNFVPTQAEDAEGENNLPTQAEDAEGVINLPTLVGTPVPWPDAAITAVNAAQITELARWGREPISAVARSPDGKSFAFTSSTMIYVYDSATFEQVRSINNGSRTCCLAYSPDGTKLASGFNDTSVKIWDATSGGELQTLTGDGNYFLSFDFSPDGKILAVGNYQSPVKLWDLNSGQLLRTMGKGEVFSFSPDGTILAIAEEVEESGVSLWDVASGQLLRDFPASYVHALAFSADGTLLASTVYDKTIKLWEVATGYEVQAIVEPVFISDIAFLPEGNQLLYAPVGKAITLWDIASGQVLQTLGNANPWGDIMLARDGKTVLYYGREGDAIKLIDIASGEESHMLTWPAYNSASIAFSPDGQFIAVGMASGSIRLLDVSNGQVLRTLPGHVDGVDNMAFGADSLAFSPDGTHLASGSGSSTKLWDVASGTELSSMVGQHCSWGCTHACVAFSPDGKILAFGAEGTQVILWDVTNNVELRALTAATGTGHGFGEGVSSVAFSPDSTMLASGNDSGAIAVWDVASGQKLHYLTGQTEAISGLVFSRDGKNLISAAQNKHIMFWDTANWSEVRTISWTGESDELNLVLSPEGSVLASSGGWSGTAVLWNSASGEVINKLGFAAMELAFSPDGKVLITVSGDGTIRCWGIAPPNVIQSEANIGLPGVEITPAVEYSPAEVFNPIVEPFVQATPEELGVEKIPIPVFLTAQDIQLGGWSPDGSYLYYTLQGPIGGPGPDQAMVTLSFLDGRTGENCEGVRETKNISEQWWGAEWGWQTQTQWLSDNRVLHLSPSGELLAITPCSDTIENWRSSLPERIISLYNAKADSSQIILLGDQAYWLFTPSTRQSVKLDIPLPEEGVVNIISWSPGDEKLIASRIEDRQDEKWIILEEIDTATGGTSLILEIQASQDIENSYPMMAYFQWVGKDKVLIDNTMTGMRLYDISNQPTQFTNVFPDLFGFEDPYARINMPYPVMGTGDEDFHLVLSTDDRPDGQYYVYHPESGVVDQYPLDPPLLVIFPTGEAYIVQSTINPPTRDVFRVILIDSNTEPYDLVVKGHAPRVGSGLSAVVLPGLEQALFSSVQGISLVDLKSGEILRFWELENQERYADFYTWLSPDGKSMVGFAPRIGEQPGAGSQIQDIYWLRLEP